MRRAKWLAVCAMAAFCCASSARAEITIKPVAGVYNLFSRTIPDIGDPISPITLHLDGKGHYSLRAMDAFGNRTGWREDVDLDGPQDVTFDGGIGYFRIEALQEGVVAGAVEIGVVPPSHPGIRPDSFFASNTSNLRTGDELRLLQTIGIKVQRSHFYNVAPATLEEMRQHDSWPLPIVGYAVDNRRTPLAEKLNMHGPPADFNAFVTAWEQILRQHPDITTYEFWNEPWIFGWTWADTPAEYRRLQKMWCEMALRVNPKLRILAGNSWMFVQDHIQPYPDSYKGLLQGTTHHPYSGASDLTYRPGANARSIDAGAQITRQMELPYYYETEGGTSVGAEGFGAPPPGVTGPSNLYNARKLVQYFVRSAQAGSFQCNTQWGIGYGPEWTMPNTAMGAMTYFLEDRAIAADIWPKSELLSGAVFANPADITDEVKALPRASELAARWRVPMPADRVNDHTKVAVIWAWTGADSAHVDQTGELLISNADGLRAFDMFGREIPFHSRLLVPFGENPVYIVSDTLSVKELRDRIAQADIDGVTPVNAYAESLTKPADQEQDLTVRLENQLGGAVTGHLTVQILGLRSIITVPFSAEAGQLVEVKVPWPGVDPSPNNQYPINLSATVDTVDGRVDRGLGRFIHSQIVEAARFVRRTITPDGKLDDWAGVTPAVLISNAAPDFTAYLLNPTETVPETTPMEKATARIYTAYDDDYVYIAVQGWPAKTTVGEVARAGAPYKKGDPKGLDYISTCGDVVQVAFGFRDRVPGIGRQMDDPWAWKGAFYDTDYQYAAYQSPDGPRLTREWGADTDRRTAYQIDDVPFVGPVPNAKAAIADGIYELAIPRSELKLFDPAAGRLRFSVLLNGKHNWAETAGVFDYWQNPGSFGPSWEFRLPCQTYFGIAKEKE